MVIGLYDGVTIVVPTYNERENIRVLIPMISKILHSSKISSYEILVVDDNSPDGTWLEAEKLGKKYPVRVLRRVNRRGLASAILEGIANAYYDNVIVMDADLQHPPAILPDIIHALSRSDIVIASRYRGGRIEKWSFMRRMMSFTAMFLAKLLIPKIRRIGDPLSGFFGIKKTILRGVRLRALGFKVLLEILSKAEYGTIEEVPYEFSRRRYGSSKLGLKVIRDYIKHVIRISAEIGALSKIMMCVLAIIVFLFILLLP